MFSPLQRKTLHGGSFKTKDQLREAIEAFFKRHNDRAKPFHWRKREVKGSQLQNTIVNLRILGTRPRLFQNLFAAEFSLPDGRMSRPGAFFFQSAVSP